MFRVAVVGDHGSGKTTFLGLLYAALVSSGSGKGDDLRFHVAYDSLDEITVLFQRLMSGGFPDSATKEGLHELRVELEMARSGHGVFSRLGSRNRGTGQAGTIHFSLPGSLDEASPGLHQGSTFGTGKWRDALDADALVMLADGTRLAAKGTDVKTGPMAAYDGRLEALFIAIQRWRSSGGREVLHPVFVLSKFDSVRPEVLKVANVEAKPPAVGKAGLRVAYAKALLDTNLPRTLALLQGPRGKKLRFAPPAFVFSRVTSEAEGPDRAERIKLRRTDGGGWEPDYSRDEYLAFLEHLARIASEAKD
ncbi:MAG TPA: hypothetical protein HA326_02095 [Thermoplasmata archaeon]|nr:hypothetical protein [Thermoplasmata archaeon]